jgi:hypothetical protein
MVPGTERLYTNREPGTGTWNPLVTDRLFLLSRQVPVEVRGIQIEMSAC